MPLFTKKIRHFLTLSIIVPISGFAGMTGDANKSSNFTGLYIGGGIGANATSTSINNTSNFAITNFGSLTSPSQVSLKNNHGTVLGELELGYSYLMKNKFYLGISGFVDLASRRTNNYLNLVKSGDGAPIYQDMKYSTSSLSDVTGGITIDPGFTISPNTLLIGMIGWERALEQLTANQLVSIQFSSQGQQLISTENNINGLKLGLGFLEQVTPSVVLGVRYTHTTFSEGSSVSTPITNTTVVPNGILFGPFNYTIGQQKNDTQSVLINIRYYWNNSNLLPQVPKPAPQGLDGFYVTGRLGAMIPNTTGTSTYISDSYIDRGAFLNKPMLTASQPDQDDSPAVSLAIGTGKIIQNCVYLGVEGIIDWSKKDINSTLSHGIRPTTVVSGQMPDLINHNLTMKLREFEPAVDVKIGMLIPHNLLPYIRAGVAFNKVEYGISDQLSYFNQNDIYSTQSLVANDNKSSRGNLRLGVGFEYQYSENNTFSLNYIYTYYGKFNITQVQTTTDGAGNLVTLSDTSKIKLNNNVLSIGYTHYFGTMLKNSLA